MRDSAIRPAAVAGRFYPVDPADLATEVDRYLGGDGSQGDDALAALMVPHAGYVYSGEVAGRTFARARIPESAIVLCPNHTGRGPSISVYEVGAFALPGGEVPIDAELAAAVLARCPDARADHSAHAREHAIEVELPFLRRKNPDVRIVPIVLGGLDAAAAVALGEALALAIADAGRDAIVVASSDMSHYLGDAEAREVDHRALAPLLAFDPTELHRTVTRERISMCGYVPATAMLAYARAVGAGAPELVAYATSGDASGDRDRVVGYAGVILAARR